jgi:hypothetical protein
LYNEITEAEQDYNNFKNPQVKHTEYGDFAINETVFAAEQSLRQVMK